jgi:hypothetical protein
MNSPECNSGFGMQQYFINHGVVERQRIMYALLRSTLSGLLNSCHIPRP